MNEDPNSRSDRATGWLRERIKKAAEKAIENAILFVLLAIVTAGGGLAAVVGLASEHPVVSTIVAFIALLAIIAIIVLLTLGALRRRYEQRIRHAEQGVRELASEVAELRTDVAKLAEAARLAESGKTYLYDCLQSLQDAFAGPHLLPLDEIVERGVLGGVRGFLVRGGDVRLAVLVPDEGGDHFVYRWAAGHTPAGVHRYRRPIDATLAGRAYTTGEVVHIGDVSSEPSFTRNPEATRDFAALVAVPLRVGQNVVGVLSVVSTDADAFNASDVTFIKLVSAILNILLALENISS